MDFGKKLQLSTRFGGISISPNEFWGFTQGGILALKPLKSTNVQFRMMLKESTNAQPSTKATMTQNQCWWLVPYQTSKN